MGQNKDLLKFVPNYPINLIAPANIKDDDFEKFRTDLGLAMKVLKHQDDDADKVIGETNHRKIDRNTAVFLNRVAKLELDFDEKGDDVDMCLAMENRMKREKITGVIEYMKDEGISDSDIIRKIMERYHVTKEYVLAILSPKTV